MSSYLKKTKHPITGIWEMAYWMDDYFGQHLYGVRFADQLVFNPEMVKLETKEKYGKFADFENLTGLSETKVS